MGYSILTRLSRCHHRVAPGDRRHRAAPRATSGFTLIELIAVVVILAVISVVAVPVFADLRAQANIAALRATASAFVEGMRLAKAAWYVKSDGTAVVDLPGYGDGTVDFGTPGYPVGTSVVDPLSPGLASHARCAEIFRAVVPGKTVWVGPSYPAPAGGGFNYFALGNVSSCTFFPLVSDGTGINTFGECAMYMTYGESNRYVEVAYDCDLHPELAMTLQ